MIENPETKIRDYRKKMLQNVAEGKDYTDSMTEEELAEIIDCLRALRAKAATPKKKTAAKKKAKAKAKDVISDDIMAALMEGLEKGGT